MRGFSWLLENSEQQIFQLFADKFLSLQTRTMPKPERPYSCPKHIGPNFSSIQL